MRNLSEHSIHSIAAVRSAGAGKKELLLRRGPVWWGCRGRELFDPGLFWFPFQIDHVITRKHGGGSQPENLAYAGLYCNSYKGPNLSGVDPLTGEIVRLFNPRTEKWSEHFEWRGAWLSGISTHGRATIQVLNINSQESALVRENLIREGKF